MPRARRLPSNTMWSIGALPACTPPGWRSSLQEKKKAPRTPLCSKSLIAFHNLFFFPPRKYFVGQYLEEHTLWKDALCSESFKGRPSLWFSLQTVTHRARRAAAREKPGYFLLLSLLFKASPVAAFPPWFLVLQRQLLPLWLRVPPGSPTSWALVMSLLLSVLRLP